VTVQGPAGGESAHKKRTSTPAERTRIHEVLTATRTSGGSTSAAADELAVEMGRSREGVLRLYKTQQNWEWLKQGAGQQISTGRYTAAVGAHQSFSNAVSLPGTTHLNNAGRDESGPKDAGIELQAPMAGIKREMFRRYTEAERARIREVYTTTWPFDPASQHVVDGLAAELGRTRTALVRQFEQLRSMEALGVLIDPRTDGELSGQGMDPERVRAFTPGGNYTMQELAVLKEAFHDVCAGRAGSMQAARAVGEAIGMRTASVLHRFDFLRRATRVAKGGKVV
jgi:hypothetical protein